MRSLVVICALIVASVGPVAAACGGDGGGSKSSANIEVKSAGGSSDGGSSGGSEAIKVAMKDNVYDPKELTVAAGKTVKVTVNNTGTVIHNMHVLSQATEGKDFTSEMMVQPGTSNTFEIKLSKKGTVKFQCDFHVPDMVGTITVK